MMKLRTCSSYNITSFLKITLLIICWMHEYGGNSVAATTPLLVTVSGTAKIPCNIPDLSSDKEDVANLMWYKDGLYLSVFNPDNGRIDFADMAPVKRLKILLERAEISDVVVSDSGEYMCKATIQVTENGSIAIVKKNSTVILLVQDVPASPFTPNITEVLSRSITVTWSNQVDGNNSPVSAYYLQIRDMMKKWSESREMAVGSDVLQFTIRELHPYMSYQIRLLAKNGIGKGPPCDPTETVTTKSEAPSAAPSITKVFSPSPAAILLEWVPPPEDKLNGELQGYQVICEILGENQAQAILVNKANQTKLLIENLRAYTDYDIHLMAFNPIDQGPSARAVLKTAEGVPDPPRITHVSDRTPDSLVVHWEPPDVVNGIMKTYELQWDHNGSYATRILSGALSNPMSSRINELRAYTQYTIRVSASTNGGKGNYSDTYPALTDVDKPTAPVVVNVTSVGSNSIYLEWSPPAIFYKIVDSYLIEYKAEGGSSYWQKYVPDGAVNEYLLENLEANKRYMITVAGITQSIFSKSYYAGDRSKPVMVELVDSAPVSRRYQNPIKAGIIAGVVVTAVVFIVLITLIVGARTVACRRVYNAAYYYFHVGDVSSSNATPSTIVTIAETYEEADYPDIPIVDFARHVESMHADSGFGFAQEFEAINLQTRSDLKSENSNIPENRIKNRYINIAAFDHTRVTLKPITGRQRHADYINGNYVDGYKKPKAYIAIQGPLPQTFADHWRMIWEQNSSVIVMITNLIERGRRKCDQYWPNEGVENYGTMAVKLLGTFPRAHYTVRIFSLRNLRIKKKLTSERIVHQYHYTEWPDHGVPDFTLPVLKYVRKSAAASQSHAGPIVVHCSAGVGRTGTYIIIDSMIEQMKDEGTLNIANMLLHIRQQRNYLVQTEDQYSFIHDVLLEYIDSGGDTEVRDIELSKYIEDIDVMPDRDEKESRLERQYKLVISFEAEEHDFSAALEHFNHDKNRNKDFLPVNFMRVLLPTRPGVEGSDYINASFLQGCNRSEEFIVTQHPLSNTIANFWRMVWDQNSSTVVLLSRCDDEEYKQFWPEKETSFEMEAVSFNLAFRENRHNLNYVTHDFILESTQDDYVLMTRMFSTSYWPESCSPISTAFEFIACVRQWYNQHDSGPIIVIDRFGGVQAAAFCALWTMYDQLCVDGAVDVYQLAKLYHRKRPGIIGTREDYHFLYKAIDAVHQDRIEKTSSHNASPRHIASFRAERDGPYSASMRHLAAPVLRNGSLPRSRSVMGKIETKI